MSETIPGQWFTIKQLKDAGSTLTENGIHNILARNAELFQTRGEGTRKSPTEILVTSENLRKLRITTELDFRREEFLKKGAGEVLIHTNSGEYKVSATETYGYGYFADIVTRVLPVSAARGLERVFDDIANHQEGPSKRVDGSRLIGLLVEISNAIIPDSSLPVFLSGEAGVNINEAREYLPELLTESLMQELSLFGIKYIPRQKIPELVKALRKKVHGVEEWPEEVDLRTESLKLRPSEGAASNIPEPKRTKKPSLKNKEKRNYTPTRDETNKGFWIPIPGILERTGMHFTTLYAKARTGKITKRESPRGIEILVTQDNLAELHLPQADFEALYAQTKISSGKRLTAQQLSEISGLHIATIRTRLKNHEEELQVRRSGKGVGRAYEATVTRENCGLLGISPEKYDLIAAEQVPPIQTIEATPVPQGQATPQSPIQPPVQTKPRTDRKGPEKTLEGTVNFNFSGKSCDIDPSEAYTRAEVSGILKQVHPGYLVTGFD